MSSHVTPVTTNQIKPNKERKRVSMHFPDYSRGLADLSTVPDFTSIGHSKVTLQETIPSISRREKPQISQEEISRRMGNSPPSDSSDGNSSSDDGPGDRRPQGNPKFLTVAPGGVKCRPSFPGPGTWTGHQRAPRASLFSWGSSSQVTLSLRYTRFTDRGLYI
jgi:hypothetical protein